MSDYWPITSLDNNEHYVCITSYTKIQPGTSYELTIRDSARNPDNPVKFTIEYPSQNPTRLFIYQNTASCVYFTL